MILPSRTLHAEVHDEIARCSHGAYELESSLSMINFVAKGLADAFFQFARRTLA